MMSNNNNYYTNTSSNNVYKANVIVANNNNTTTDQSLSYTLTKTIIETSIIAINERNAFTIALSGGSIPTFLEIISNFNTNTNNNYKIQYDKWYIVLADERCVPIVHTDSNLGLLQKTFLSKTTIPLSNIYGINESILQSLLLLQSDNANDNNNDNINDNDNTTTIETIMNNIAIDYETKIQSVLVKSNGLLDMAILGFGPDGHTCSLFPNHPIVLLYKNENEIQNENEKQQESAASAKKRLIVPIIDSPKLPLYRITVTLSVLNTITRNIIFCGIGISKSIILQNVFHSLIDTNISSTSTRTDHDNDNDDDDDDDDKITMKNDDNKLNSIKHYIGTYIDPPPYPCAMVRPLIEQNTTNNNNGNSNKLPVTWIVDDDAIKDVLVLNS